MYVLECEGVATCAVRTQLLNDIMTTFFKSPEFLQNTIMGVMRLKFRTGEGFTIHPAHLKLGSIARLLSEKFGAVFDPKLRKFTGFFEQPIVSGHTARKPYEMVKAVVSRRVQELLVQSSSAKPTTTKTIATVFDGVVLTESTPESSAPTTRMVKMQTQPPRKASGFARSRSVSSIMITARIGTGLIAITAASGSSSVNVDFIASRLAAAGCGQESDPVSFQCLRAGRPCS